MKNKVNLHRFRYYIKNNFISVLTFILLLVSTSCLIYEIPYLYRYTSFLSSEIKFINAYGMQSEFSEGDEQPVIKGPAFIIEPPITEEGEVKTKIFIDEYTHNTHKKALIIFGVSSTSLTSISIYSIISLRRDIVKFRKTSR